MRPHEFGQVFDRNGAGVEHGFVITTQLEFVAEFTLDLLTQAVMSHSADKVGAQLARTLFRANDLKFRFTLRLEAVLSEELKRLVVGEV